jgi:hypothetical protein
MAELMKKLEQMQRVFDEHGLKMAGEKSNQEQFDLDQLQKKGGVGGGRASKASKSNHKRGGSDCESDDDTDDDEIIGNLDDRSWDVPNDVLDAALDDTLEDVLDGGSTKPAKHLHLMNMTWTSAKKTDAFFFVVN